MSRALTVLAFALSLAPALAAPPATSTHLSDKVKIDVFQNAFHVEQDWEVRGATRAELMAAVPHLTLSGRYGVYGDRELVKTDVPEELQNTGEGVSAWAHPILVPSMFGSRASTVPNAEGFVASMSGGMLGRGSSQVTIASTPGGCHVSERGTWTLAHADSGEKVFDVPFNLGAATFGRIPLVLAHKTMGKLHNTMFQPVQALVNWVNDHR